MAKVSAGGAPVEPTPRRRNKLTERTVRLIRKRLARGDRQVDIAADLGVAQPTVSRVKRGECWAWVDAS